MVPSVCSAIAEQREGAITLRLSEMSKRLMAGLKGRCNLIPNSTSSYACRSRAGEKSPRRRAPMSVRSAGPTGLEGRVRHGDQMGRRELVATREGVVRIWHRYLKKGHDMLGICSVRVLMSIKSLRACINSALEGVVKEEE